AEKSDCEYPSEERHDLDLLGPRQSHGRGLGHDSNSLLLTRIYVLDSIVKRRNERGHPPSFLFLRTQPSPLLVLQCLRGVAQVALVWVRKVGEVAEVWDWVGGSVVEGAGCTVGRVLGVHQWEGRARYSLQLDGGHVVEDSPAVGETGRVASEQSEPVRCVRCGVGGRDGWRNRHVEAEFVGLDRATEVLESGDDARGYAGEED